MLVTNCLEHRLTIKLNLSARQFDDLKISKLDDETLVQALDNGLEVGIRDALCFQPISLCKKTKYI